ncbi:FAD-dependent monooxygenase [Actinobacillus genomosp. 1]|uniref:FAD-dependent monooxygenase n=1 Tax=Actinobacillus genomosp. 1 TaxID=254839 RepID=UPI002441D9E5|nr:FAD-dependent monooxygenase [Actinobacillus genomosp. 1]WGE91713.1 FAD-dependent monooxygenase [Actinobacillus genomosp. 1]
MKSADIIIIGGGMVGLAFAALLKNTESQIKIIEKQVPQTTKTFSNRVSAINATSEKMLEQVGALQLIQTERLSPYQKMSVWEQDSFAQIEFDNSDTSIQQLGLDKLGYIIENNQIQSALWQQVSRQDNVEIILSEPNTVGVSENGAFLTLASGEMISAKLVVGADGANSWLRRQMYIPLISKDYEQTALVCNVKTAEPHTHTARQNFSADSILAFLPLADEHLCSIVWSLPTEKAKQLQHCEVQQFNRELTIAFDNRLGLVELQSERATYPLTARYARDFAQSRIALIGDAAHTIHPLAGLGVNLGFADAITLAQEVRQHLMLGHDIGEYRHLRRFERTRKAEAVKLLTAMEGLKQLFQGDHPVKKLIRGIGLSATNQLPILKKLLIEQAIGV